LADLTLDIIPDNDQTRARSEHLEALRQLVGNVYPNKFVRSRTVEPGRDDVITTIFEKFRGFQPQVPEGGRPLPEEIELANQQLNTITVRLAGRIASPPRVMGKAAFVHLSDGVGRLQVYARKADLKAINNDTGLPIENETAGWEMFGLLDHGDFIGVEGFLFVTKTGELSVHVQTLQFLAKALLPLPDKMHGINDPEIRQRQRYADLIAGSLKLEREEGELTPREVFERRAAVIREFRRILDDEGYIEVETPMLTTKATGAAARPFKTHHNALDIDLYARIAPELYLKRLLVGGFEKVYELNRNFRNEGISTRHNPEFTMLEFYWAYADVNQMMDFCEAMMRATVFKVMGHTQAQFGEHVIDFSKPFQRLTMKEAVVARSKMLTDIVEQTIDETWLESTRNAADLLKLTTSWIRQRAIEYNKLTDVESVSVKVGDSRYWDFECIRSKVVPRMLEEWMALRKDPSKLGSDESAAAESIQELFELVCEHELSQPTFVTDYPKIISPLSKASPTNPNVAERFELFIAGMECANGFSELNDPVEQALRFTEQVQQRERGDEEAMVMDEDYIRALSYGMPPAAGIGIGIDRFVMLLTNRQSIRDVILFPHMRPERKFEEPEPESGDVG
jgi:lysyl-tRNA synthetase class 2